MPRRLIYINPHCSTNISSQKLGDYIEEKVGEPIIYGISPPSKSTIATRILDNPEIDQPSFIHGVSYAEFIFAEKHTSGALLNPMMSGLIMDYEVWKKTLMETGMNMEVEYLDIPYDLFLDTLPEQFKNSYPDQKSYELQSEAAHTIVDDLLMSQSRSIH